MRSDNEWSPGVSEKRTATVSRRRISGYSGVSRNSERAVRDCLALHRRPGDCAGSGHVVDLATDGFHQSATQSLRVFSARRRFNHWAGPTLVWFL